MDTRTAEIIMCLKGNCSLDGKYPYPGLGRYYDIIAMYMADRCAVDVRSYSKSDIRRVIRTAVADYIQSCDNPAGFLNDYFDACSLDINNEHDECQHWCEALGSTRVRRGDDWVNGFNDQLGKFVYATC